MEATVSPSEFVVEMIICEGATTVVTSSVKVVVSAFVNSLSSAIVLSASEMTVRPAELTEPTSP